MKLSILIPYTSERLESCERLIKNIRSQSNEREVEILLDSRQLESIGTKRNILLENARGEYVAFIDSDDEISDSYISELMEGINKGVDCCSLRGVITWDGENPELFEHSIKYSEWRTNGTGGDIKYERTINHLNCVKSSIAKQFKFPEINHGEDRFWSEAMHRSGLIKTEHHIDKIMYHYLYKINK